MNQHENDLDPEPLTVTGFNGGCCCQTVSPGFNRTPVELTAKGYRWISSQSSYNFIAWDNDVAENLSHERHHTSHWEFAGNPDRINPYPESNFHGFKDCCVATDPDIHTMSLLTHPIQTVLLLFQKDLIITMRGIYIARLYSIEPIKPSCYDLNYYLKLIIQPHCFEQLCGKIHFRWQKTLRLYQPIDIVNMQIGLITTSVKGIQQIDIQLNLN